MEMNGLEPLLSREYDLERLYQGFLSSLDKERIITLRHLLLYPDTALSKLKAEWVNVDLLLSRFKAAVEFLNQVKPNERVPGYKSTPLIFLQSTKSREDENEFKQRCSESGFFEEKYSHLPPQIHYLHTQTNFMGKLIGTWRSSKRTFMPLNHFTSRAQYRIDKNGRTWKAKPMILGLHVPNYPKLLEVDNDIATDYFARIVIHDLGHGILPRISLDYESVHDVTMIYAMNTVNNHTSSNPWEMLIHAECSNPFFFLEAKKYLLALNVNDSPVKNLLIEKFQSEFTSDDVGKDKPWSNRAEKKEKLWGIKPNDSLSEATEKVTKTIGSMLKNGFHLYQ